jgi:hypothetical protein
VADLETLADETAHALLQNPLRLQGTYRALLDFHAAGVLEGRLQMAKEVLELRQRQHNGVIFVGDVRALLAEAEREKGVG